MRALMIQFRRHGPEDAAPESGARFRPGELVFHRRYRYRGVVVGLDPRCLASEAWYQGNMTQPNRDQPWYHVLPDGETHARYVAEDHLMPDPTGAPIEHPLIDVYFSGFAAGFYLRNAKGFESE
jgi:heat shock protein HspQ